MLAGSFPEGAGRDAYLAAMHAALALIVGRTGKEPKTHTGTRSEFARLVRHEPRVPVMYAAFLARAYDFKTFADYAGDAAVTLEDASAAMATAADLVDLIEMVVPCPPTAGS